MARDPRFSFLSCRGIYTQSTQMLKYSKGRDRGMGRPPCCEKVGVKKGPWTPEEDIILVSYIQQHGPGNWRSVPTNTGLLRCSKSCRLRWTNYLRPGIKRGNFTPHEEGMIIHLQALLGNKWAAIASYLPQRTDNDIKNYWNTHLKKKLNKFQEPNNMLHIPTTSTYASSTENISRLLQGWMRSSSPNHKLPNNVGASGSSQSDNNQLQAGGHDFFYSHEKFPYTFDNMNNSVASWDTADNNDHQKQISEKNINPPLSILENWLFDETSGQVEEMMQHQLSPIF